MGQGNPIPLFVRKEVEDGGGGQKDPATLTAFSVSREWGDAQQ